MESQGTSEVIQIDRNVRKYWRVKVPKKMVEGAVEGGDRAGGGEGGSSL
jgi:hypothetical protein